MSASSGQSPGCGSAPAEDAAAALPTFARNTKLNELIHTFLDDLTADFARV